MLEKIRLTKVGSVVPNGRPKGEWMEGELLYPVCVGQHIVLRRVTKNGMENSGVFNTSRVVSLEGELASTPNSVYRIEQIKEYTAVSTSPSWRVETSPAP